MSVLHKIRAYLYENLLTKENSNNYIARTASEHWLNVEQICEAAVNRGGADISSTSMEHAVDLFMKEMAYHLCEGYSINTGYFTAGTQIRGAFTNSTETFNSDKHSILFVFNQGNKLRAEISNIRVDVLGLADSSASILQVTDIKSGTVNDLLTPGKLLKIGGNKIKIAGASSSNGIFFINTATQERTAVDIGDIVSNKPPELVVVIPPTLTAGTYTVEVVTQYAGSVLLKSPRIAKFTKTLTVK